MAVTNCRSATSRLAMARGTARRIVPRVGVLKESVTTPTGPIAAAAADVAVDAVGGRENGEGDIRDHRTDHPHGEHAVGEHASGEHSQSEHEHGEHAPARAPGVAFRCAAARTDGRPCRSTRCRAATCRSSVRPTSRRPEMIAEPPPAPMAPPPEPVIAQAPQPVAAPEPPPPVVPTILADAPPEKPKRGWWRR